MRIQLASDLFKDNPVLVLLPVSGEQPSPMLAGIEVQLERNGCTTGEIRLKAIELALGAVLDTLSGWQVWLLGCHSAWQPASRVASFKRLWKSLEARQLKIPTGDRLEEFAVESEDGQRWFGAVAVADDEISLLGPILAAEAFSLIVVLPEGLQPNLRRLLDVGWASFAPSEITGWRDLAIYVCREGALLFRPFGNFDDQEVGTDVLVPTPLAARLYEAMIGRATV